MKKDFPTALVIMAAGLGSRFKHGLKQLASVGQNDELIIEYSVHDAILAGFNRIIFIIRSEIEQDFKDKIGYKIERICDGLDVEVSYAYQRIDDIPEGESVPPDRVKPWGTGQAVLSCADLLDCPFAVINADDFYGKKSFKLLHDALISSYDNESDTMYMVGYTLKNTLSENGAVKRGICKMDDEGYLTRVDETEKVYCCEGHIYADEIEMSPDTLVSMNMWGLNGRFIKLLQEGFEHFFKENKDELSTKEFLIPVFVGELLKKKGIKVRVLPISEKWYGITYSEDVNSVRNAIQGLIESGEYKSDLFSDLQK